MLPSHPWYSAYRYSINCWAQHYLSTHIIQHHPYPIHSFLFSINRHKTFYRSAVKPFIYQARNPLSIAVPELLTEEVTEKLRVHGAWLKKKKKVLRLYLKPFLRLLTTAGGFWRRLTFGGSSCRVPDVSDGSSCTRCSYKASKNSDICCPFRFLVCSATK